MRDGELGQIWESGTARPLRGRRGDPWSSPPLPTLPPRRCSLFGVVSRKFCTSGSRCFLPSSGVLAGQCPARRENGSLTRRNGGDSGTLPGASGLTLGIIDWQIQVPNLKVERYGNVSGVGVRGMRAIYRTAGHGRGAKAVRDRGPIVISIIPTHIYRGGGNRPSSIRSVRVRPSPTRRTQTSPGGKAPPFRCRPHSSAHE